MYEKGGTLSNYYPDIVLHLCPFDCEKKICEKEWINEQIGNKIICKCKKCGHKKVGEVSGNRGVLENNHLFKNQS